MCVSGREKGKKEGGKLEQIEGEIERERTHGPLWRMCIEGTDMGWASNE